MDPRVSPRKDTNVRHFSDSDDDDDDWLFKSVKTYDELHMYDLLNPSPVIEWTSNSSVCIACQLPNGQSELLQLALPSSLLPGPHAIRKEHDFQVLNGGFYDHHIVAVRHVFNSGVLVTAEAGNNCVSLWTMPPENSESGLIKRSETVANRRPMEQAAVIDTVASKAAFGDQTDTVCIIDVSTAQIMLDTTSATSSSSGELLSRLLFLDENCLICCSRTNGSIGLWDLRIGHQVVQLNSSQIGGDTVPHCSMIWTCQKLNRSSETPAVLRLSSNGSVVRSDIRNTHGNVLETKIEQTFSERTHNYMTIVEYMIKFLSQLYGCQLLLAADEKRQLIVSASCISRDCFTVNPAGNGCDGNVYVYKMPEACADRLYPYFTHTGHNQGSSSSSDVTVWTSCWHPGTVRNTLMSSASNSSLHAWQFAETDCEKKATALA